MNGVWEKEEARVCFSKGILRASLTKLKDGARDDPRMWYELSYGYVDGMVWEGQGKKAGGTQLSPWV